MNDRERREQRQAVVHVEGRTVSTDDASLKFDYGYGPESAQEEVNNDIGHEVVKNAVSGYNSVVFAYGKTGSGKTHTMTNLIDFVLCELMEEVQQAAAQSAAAATGRTPTFRIDAYYFEIYNEDIYDLWAPSGRRKVSRPMFVDRKTGYVDLQSLGLTKEPVRSVREIQALLLRGRDARATSATKLNAHSSRSHAILRLECTQTAYEYGRGADQVCRAVDTFSCHDLVDLAGSENTRASGATGVNHAEAGKINQSLVTLQRVIEALFRISKLSAKCDATSQHPAQVFVPYRDSKLTYLLRPSLGGNAKAFMIATVSPADQHATSSTLDYARKCAQVVNHPKVNTNENKKALGQWKAEIEALSQKLKLTQAQLDEQRVSSQLDETAAETIRAKDARIAALEQQVAQMRAEDALKSKELEAMQKRSEAIHKSSKELRAALEQEAARSQRAQERAQLNEEGLRHYRSINEALCTAIDKLQSALPNDDDGDEARICAENRNPNARKATRRLARKSSGATALSLKDLSGTLESLTQERDFVRQVAAAHISSLENQLDGVTAQRDELHRIASDHVLKAMDHVQRLEQSVVTGKDRLNQAFEDSDNGDLSSEDLQEILGTSLAVMFLIAERLCGALSEDLDHARVRLTETASSAKMQKPARTPVLLSSRSSRRALRSSAQKEERRSRTELKRNSRVHVSKAPRSALQPQVQSVALARQPTSPAAALDLNTTADFFDPIGDSSETSDVESELEAPHRAPRDAPEPKRAPSPGVTEFLQSMEAMATADLSALGIAIHDGDDDDAGFATPVSSPR